MPEPATASSARRSGMPEPAAAASRFSDFPDCVILDTLAHIGLGDKAPAAGTTAGTTAGTMTSAKRPIEVSFEIADPPGLSRCFVHLRDLTLGDSWASASVTGADGAFLLIRVIFPDPDDESMVTDVFVYSAGRGEPSLYRLPPPYPVGLRSNYVGVLSCDDDVLGNHCLVVIPERRFEADGRMFYDLQIFSTNTKVWSTQVARVASDMICYRGFEPSKIFSVGGGSLAWVDLRFGILLCNVLDKDPVVRLIQLSPLMPANKVFGKTLCGVMPRLDLIRDVTFRDGWFKFIELEYPKLDEDDLTQLGWMASIFRRTIDSENWEPCGTVDSAKLSPTDSCLPFLFPEIWDYKENKLTLNKVASSTPTLDMCHDDVLYMITKLKADDPNGWVLAVNTRNNKLEKVTPFASERLKYCRTYLQCAFSNYLSKAPGTHMAKGAKKCTNREMFELLETYLLDSISLLRNIELHMESLKQRYNGSISFLISGPASSSHPNVPTEAEYGLNNDRGNDVVHAEDECLRVRKDFEYILDPINATKSKISVAHGGLYKVMRALPSDVLDEEFLE